MNRQENNKTYTFEDWLNNELVGDYLVHVDSEFQPTGYGIPLHRILCDKKDQTLLLRRNLIKKDELNRIGERQKEAYNKLISFYWSQRMDAIERARRKDKMSQYAVTRKNHLTTQIEKIETEEPGIAEKFYEGYSFFHLMDPHLYKIIINVSESATPLKLPHEYPLPDELEQMRQSGYRDFIFSSRRILEASLQLSVDHKEISFLPDIEDSSAIETDSSDIDKYPDPYEVATYYKKKRTRSRDNTYSIEDIAFVVKYARDNPNISMYSKIIHKIEADPDCPENIKGLKGTPTRWIKFYDEVAGISRTKSHTIS